MQIPSQFNEKYTDYLANEVLNKAPQNLYDPINYILSIGGKRIRPQLVLWGCYCFNEAFAKAMPVAHSVEVFHNFTLMHDDIMDDAPLRRGKPTVHTKYNTNTAILSGDAMLLLSYDYLLKCEKGKYFKKLFPVFNQVAIEVCEGQQMDMNFETADKVTLKEYMKMIELKTAALLGGAIRLGAIVGGAKQRDSKLLEKFARTMGVAFQIQDDILDSFGDPAKFGKKVGGDIVQNKKTYLYLTALKKSKGAVRKELMNWFQTESFDEQEKIESVKNIFSELQVEKEASALQADLIEKAYTQLEKVDADNAKKEALRNWTEKLVVREI